MPLRDYGLGAAICCEPRAVNGAQRMSPLFASQTMPRGRKLRPLVGPVEEWKAARDERGRWVVTSSSGERVLQHADPLVRLQAVHLAAAAPRLREVLVAVTTRFQAYLLDHGYGYTRDALLAREAWDTIGDSRPRFEEVLAVQRELGQLELPLDDVEGAA